MMPTAFCKTPLGRLEHKKSVSSCVGCPLTPILFTPLMTRRIHLFRAKYPNSVGASVSWFRKLTSEERNERTFRKTRVGLRGVLDRGEYYLHIEFCWTMGSSSTPRDMYIRTNAYRSPSAKKHGSIVFSNSHPSRCYIVEQDLHQLTIQTSSCQLYRRSPVGANPGVGGEGDPLSSRGGE